MNENLWYSSRNSTQRSVVSDRKEILQKRGDICIHAADSLFCTAETNSIINNYTLIQINLKENYKLGTMRNGSEGDAKARGTG